MYLDHLVLPEQEEPLVTTVPAATLASLESLDVGVTLVLLELKATKDKKEISADKERLALRETMDLRVSLGMMALLVLLDLLDHQEQLETLAGQASQEPTDCQETTDPRESKAIEASLETLVAPDTLDSLANLDRQL